MPQLSIVSHATATAAVWHSLEVNLDLALEWRARYGLGCGAFERQCLALAAAHLEMIQA